MAIIPSQPLNMSARDELIGIIGFMIDEAAEAPDAIRPYVLARRIADEVLVITARQFDVNTKASPDIAVEDDREQASNSHSPIRGNIVWLQGSDKPAR